MTSTYTNNHLSYLYQHPPHVHISVPFTVLKHSLTNQSINIYSPMQLQGNNKKV